MPRASATAHELARIELLGSLPGEQLAKLAGRMRRETVLAGAAPIIEGEEGDRFYAVLTGMFSVTKSGPGPRADTPSRRLLRRGRARDERPADGDRPRAHAAVVASCDLETFNEFIRPLFADDD